jgi:peptidoglycan/LPS O-acetylase OafA/YrhL/lysophospholipase L1-like esterase
VLAVLAFHEQLSGLPGGFLGVDVFFVVSGYLITDLLATPWDHGGRLDLRGFWIRRARRLLPCLAVMLVTVTAAVAVLEPDQLASLRPALLAAVTYTSNWWQALQHQSYFTVFGPPPPLQHLWSLAIEEQFYLIWPLILTVILCAFRRRRTRAAVVWLGAAASALAMAAGYAAGAEPSRLYYGLDTHATGLLVGAGLALALPLRRLAATSLADTRRLDLIGLAGITVLAWELVHVAGRGGAAYLGGIALAALAAGAVVVAAAGSGALAGLLGWAPLRWIGLRSYGIYLWHWPVIALFAARAGSQSTTSGIRIAETAAAIMLAAASWRWVEAPILHHGLGATIRSQRAAIARSITAARRSPQRALPALIPLAAVTVVGTAGYGIVYSPPGQTLQQQIAAGARVSAASVHQHVSGPYSASGSLLHPVSVQQHPVFLPRLVHPRRHPVRPLYRGSAQQPVSLGHLGRDVTAIGDSVMLAAAPQLRAALPGSSIDAQVSRQMSQGIAVARQLASSGQLRRIVVVGLGTNGPITMAQVRALRAVAGPLRALVLVNTFVPRPWQPEVNAVLAAAARQYRDVTLANWLMTIRPRTSLLWGDGVHPRPAGAAVYARILSAAVRKAAGRLDRTVQPGLPAGRTGSQLSGGT